MSEPTLTGTKCLSCGSDQVVNRTRRFAGNIPGDDKRANPHLDAQPDQFIRCENVVDVCLDCGNHMSYQVQTIAPLPPDGVGFSRNEAGQPVKEDGEQMTTDEVAQATVGDI